MSISIFVMQHLLLIFKKVVLVTAMKTNFTAMEQKHNNPHTNVQRNREAIQGKIKNHAQTHILLTFVFSLSSVTPTPILRVVID